MEARDSAAGYEPLAAGLAEQSRRIAGLTAAIEEVRRGVGGEERGRELGYRFDAYPKWLEASGWKDQSRRHRAAWPTLRRLLEIERWPGAATRITYSQLADHLCVSEDTAKRRLRDLAGELGAIELRPGSGRSPSVVIVNHPIKTPLKYGEVPWEAGGLAGAPARYLENLRGAKRHYAELYGVELPPLPAVTGEEPPDLQPPEQAERAAQTGGESQIGKPAHVAAPSEGAVRAPLETRNTCFIETPSESDAQEGKEPLHKEDIEGGRSKEEASKKIETEIRAEPPNKIGNEGRLAALSLSGATGRYDELARARLAQAAQYLISRGEESVLQTVTARIASARRRSGTEIRNPLVYVARVIQDVRLTDKLTAEERELAASVALVDDAEAAHANKEAIRPEHRSTKDVMRGYWWLFGEEPSPDEAREWAEQKQRESRERDREARERRRGYEWFFGEEESVPEPWEGSPFEGIVPTEQWQHPATAEVAGRIRQRMEDLAAAGDPEEYRRAREELYAAPWVGEPFKERVIARCDQVIWREETGARMSGGHDHE